MEHLEAEVKVLLGQLEELAWNLPPGPLGPTPDLFGDGERPRSGEDSSDWGLLSATAQVWSGRAGTGLGSSWGGVGRHPPPTHTPRVFSALTPAWGRCSLASGQGFWKGWRSSRGSHLALP